MNFRRDEDAGLDFSTSSMIAWACSQVGWRRIGLAFFKALSVSRGDFSIILSSTAKARIGPSPLFKMSLTVDALHFCARSPRTRRIKGALMEEMSVFGSICSDNILK